MNSYEENQRDENDNPEAWKFILQKAYMMGIGMATGAYDLFVINFVMLILSNQYDIGPWESSLVATASLLGTFSGQIIFGFMGDLIGRKRSSLLTCTLLFVGAIGSGAITYSFGSYYLALYCMIAFWRFLIGIGIGGEYPVTAIFTSESCPKSIQNKRGTYIASMFSAQGLGNVIAASSFLFLIVLFKSQLDLVWRTALMLGAIPPLFIFYPRFKAQEPPRFEAAARTKPDVRKIVKIYWKNLIGTAGTWFLFDIVFYGNSLFSGPILAAVGIGSETGWLGIADNVAYNIVISIMALPGYWTAAFLIDRVGRKPLQLFGFAMMSIIYITIGLTYHWISQISWLFVSFYALSYFFANAGPNTTTFVIPTETYPTVVKSTCYGLSAASGKLGAIFGSFFLKPLLNATSPVVIFLLCGFCSILGFVVTWFFTKETRYVDLEQLDEEAEVLIRKESMAINDLE